MNLSPNPHLGFGATERDIARHFDGGRQLCDNAWWCMGFCDTRQEQAFGLCESCLERFLDEQEDERK